MSRLAVLVALAMVSCAACSKKDPDTAPKTTAPLPEIKDTGPGATTRPPGPADGMTPANDASYKLAVSTPPAATVGAETVARVSVTPAAGWHMNKDFPTRLQLTAPEGVQLKKAVLELTDVSKLDDNELAFDVKLIAAKPGTYKVGGEIKFAVCTPETCDPKKQPVTFELIAQ